LVDERKEKERGRRGHEEIRTGKKKKGKGEERRRVKGKKEELKLEPTKVNQTFEVGCFFPSILTILHSFFSNGVF
jgi:hypothetical protein